MKEFDERDLELLRRPLKKKAIIKRNDPVEYFYENEYKERGIFEFALKISKLVNLLSSKHKNLVDIVAQYYVTDLTEEEAKALDTVYHNLSKKIVEYEIIHERVLRNFYRELY